MKQRILSMAVLPEGEPVFSERAYIVTIEDEAAGEYIKLTSLQDDMNGVTFDPDVWPYIRAAVDMMVAEIEKNERGGE